MRKSAPSYYAEGQFITAYHNSVRGFIVGTAHPVYFEVWCPSRRQVRPVFKHSAIACSYRDDELAAFAAWKLTQ